MIKEKKVKDNETKEYVIGVAGNPNVGKSTVFNKLTGLKQHTGNWPGKTVINAEGSYKNKDNKFKVIDLPGTYSLLSNSQEEEIARDYICFEDYDVIVVVCDSTALERNLNLFLQILEITNKVVMCVNLVDEAKKKNIRINIEKLGEELKVKIVKAVARKGIGIDELKDIISSQVEKPFEESFKVTYKESLEKAVNEVKELLSTDIEDKTKRWIALRLLENNESICISLKQKYKIEEFILDKVCHIRENLKVNLNNKSIEDEIVESIVKTAENISKKVIKAPREYNKRDEKIDKILTSKTLGIPIMILLLIIVLWMTITLSNYPSEMLANLFSLGEEKLRILFNNIDMPLWISGILIDGVYITLSWVVSVMLPPMAIFFPMFTLLEDVGYLPRMAFNLDKCFKRCCSCGKHALTMCMGLGCNAAGVIGCRIISSPKEKLIAIITNNFIPCNGRFPLLITIATIFIGGMVGSVGGNVLSAITVATFIIIGVFMTFIVSKLLSKTFLKDVKSTFVLELPSYRVPQVGNVIIRSIFDRTLYVLGRAVVVAAPAGVVIWIFANIPLGSGSLLSTCAEFLTPFASLIGVDGYILMAFILGIPANEIVMPIIIMSYLNATTMLEMNNLFELKELLVQNGWTLLTAINVMILCLMHYPCATTLLTIKKETNSMKWTALAFVIPTVAGLITCFITTQIWRLFA